MPGEIRWSGALAVSLLVVAFGGSLSGQEKAPPPLERKELDRRIYEALREVINAGADLYNGDEKTGRIKDSTACCHLWTGALMALRPLLDHRPELQKAITDGLAKAAAEEDSRKRAFILRDVLDEIRTTASTLWDRLGGEKKIETIVDDFVTSAAADPKVNFFRNDKFKKTDVAKLKKLLVEQISSIADGPYKYSGRSMKEVHAGMGITDEEFEALAGHLKDALDKNKIRLEDIQLIIKAVNGTRKDIVEPKGKPEKKPEDKKEGPGTVIGKVALDGKPLANASVTFFEDVAELAKTYLTKTGADGTYELEGLKPGKYKIKITVAEGLAIPAKYNTKTELVFEVKEKENKANFDLLSK